ncbi:MAG: AAA family ATPase, partial [Ignavibacteriae bacterium]|nr:AAA family ATPase [Ignavibacteriota bacterium]
MSIDINLHIENFKILQNVDVVLKPITLLFGANASGKSTLLEALLFLQYTYKFRNVSQIKLTDNGIIDLGFNKYEDFFYNNDVSKPIIIRIDLKGSYLNEYDIHQFDIINIDCSVKFTYKFCSEGENLLGRKMH